MDLLQIFILSARLYTGTAVWFAEDERRPTEVWVFAVLPAEVEERANKCDCQVENHCGQLCLMKDFFVPFVCTGLLDQLESVYQHQQEHKKHPRARCQSGRHQKPNVQRN